MAAAAFTVDGTDIEEGFDTNQTLLSVLRQRGFTGPKLACGRGECGACTVELNGRPILACVTLAVTVTGHITTSAGIAQSAPDIAEAFAAHTAFQCGFCTPGQIVRADALLRSTPQATADQIRSEMAGNVCRCTGYTQIVEALESVAANRQAHPSAVTDSETKTVCPSHITEEGP